jgi:hemerythrin-like domain-containing protein
MTTTMTMNRVVHDAVRRDLRRLESALAGMADGDVSRAEQLNRAYDNLRTQLTRHHESEDTLIWPVLARLGIGADLLSAMEFEHQAMSAALQETAVAMDRFSSSGSTEAAAEARESVTRTTAVVEQHLRHEEDDLEPAFRPFVESPEWKEVEKRLSHQPPFVAGAFFAWVTDGMTDEGQEYLRSTVPRPVTFLLPRVFGRRYRRTIAPVWQAG